MRAWLPGASKTVAGIDPKFYYLTLGLLALCTVVGFIVAYRFQREVNHDLAPPTEKDLLDPLEKAYYSGLMREDEFRRIQESMARQKAEPLPLSKPPKSKFTPPAASGAGGSPVLDAGTPGSINPTGDSDPGPSPG